MWREIIQNYSEIILIAFFGLILLLFVWLILVQLQVSRLKKKIKEIFRGNKASSLEEVILQQAKSMKVLDKDIQELYNISNQINNLTLRSIHKVGMVRFNPFKDVGGDQSFAIALMNGKNNGIVISSLYTREGTRVYSKTVKAGVSEKHPLTDEEQQAIKLALHSDKKIN